MTWCSGSGDRCDFSGLAGLAGLPLRAVRRQHHRSGRRGFPGSGAARWTAHASFCSSRTAPTGPSALTPTATITAPDMMRWLRRHFDISGVEPDIGPVAFERPIEEGFDSLVDLLAQPADLAFRHAQPPSPPNQFVDRAARSALYASRLDHGGEAPSPSSAAAPGSPKAAALAQLGRPPESLRPATRDPVKFVANAAGRRQRNTWSRDHVSYTVVLKDTST